jgi:hypothetical protein
MADTAAPAHITADLFRRWRSPTRGAANPHALTNPVWKWLIESRLNAYQANQLFSGESAVTAGPGWCFERFGQSTTQLPDGRTLYIAGEHEDSYDPDFFIYNDVVVTLPTGEIEIFGYPTDAFPPTDFHSATLVGEQIIVLGNLGYPSDRRAGITPVLILNLQGWRMSPIRTEGTGPGWIHEHDARLTDDASAIIISKGKVDRCDGESLVENIDDWRLSIGDWQWERLTTRHWPRFEVRRQDRRPLHLWSMRQALWSKSVGWNADAAQWVQKLEAELGSPAKLDLVPTLYQPALAHEALPEQEGEYGVYRVRVGEVVVRFVEGSFELQVTVEGDLPPEALEQMRRELVEKLATLEQVPVAYRDIATA